MPQHLNTAVAIILGAQNFERAGLESDPAFQASAAALANYFALLSGFGLGEDNVLNLFDDPKGADDTDAAIETFLQSKISNLKSDSLALTDVFVYYTGHGIFVEPNEDYAVILRATRKANFGSSAYRLRSLATTLNSHARHCRRFLILDCCFSATAYTAFQASTLDVVYQQSLEAFPGRGTSLLCASAPDRPAKSRLRTGSTFSGMTLFSECLVSVLTNGVGTVSSDRLSLADVAHAVADLMTERFSGEGPRPQLKSPDERDGDISLIPLFPNVGYVRHRVNEGSTPKQSGDVLRSRVLTASGRALLTAMAPGALGGVVLAGSFGGTLHLDTSELTSDRSRTAFVAALDADLKILFARTFEASFESYITGVACHGEGVNIAVGFVGDFTIDERLFTTTKYCEVVAVRLTANLAVIWTNHIRAPEGRFVVESMTCDSAGNIYLCGDAIGPVYIEDHIFPGMTEREDGFVVKLDSDGRLQWAERLVSRGQTQTRGCATSQSGYVAISGLFREALDIQGRKLQAEQFGGFVAVLDHAGRLLWTDAYDAPNGAQAVSLHFGSSDQLYSTDLRRGKTQISDSESGDAKTALVKYNKHGEILWSRFYGNNIFPCSVTLTFSEDVFWTGYFQNTIKVGTVELQSKGGYDILLMKVSSEGTPLWACAFGDHRQQFLARCVTGSTGLLMFAGSFHGAIALGKETYVATGCSLDGSDEGDEDIFVATVEP